MLILVGLEAVTARDSRSEYAEALQYFDVQPRVIWQQVERKKSENCDRKQHINEPKPPIASSKLPFLRVRFVRLVEELGDVTGLELVENRVVGRTAALEKARHDFLK